MSDAGSVVRCFPETAIVIDERREHRGQVAIAQRKAEATAKYHLTSEPLRVDVSEGEAAVMARVTGDFPGSPVELRYRFGLEDDRIARLEITSLDDCCRILIALICGSTTCQYSARRVGGFECDGSVRVGR
jgi:hypothetical protein